MKNVVRSVQTVPIFLNMSCTYGGSGTTRRRHPIFPHNPIMALEMKPPPRWHRTAMYAVVPYTPLFVSLCNRFNSFMYDHTITHII